MAFPIPPNVSDADFRKLVLQALSEGVTVAGVNLTGDITFGNVAIDQLNPGANGVTVKSSALPSGAATEATSASILGKLISAPATEAKQDTANSALASLLSLLVDPAKAALQSAANALLTAINNKITACNTGAVAVASSALPSGASTEATLAALSAKLSKCNTDAAVIASGHVVAGAQEVVRTQAIQASSLLVKNSAGKLFTLTGFNAGPAQFLQVHDAAALPANGAVPALVVGVPAVSTFAFEWADGIPFANGIVVCNSYGTSATKTIGSADCHITATSL